MGLIFFKGPFWGAYFWREICISKPIRLTLWLEGNLPFLLCFTLYLRAISKYKPPGGLYLEGRFNGGFFASPVWGAYIWRGLYMEGLIFGILRYVIHKPWKCPQLPMGMSAYRNVKIRSLSGSWNRFLWRRLLMEVSIRRVFTVDFLTNKCMNCIFLDRCGRELCIHQLPQI